MIESWKQYLESNGAVIENSAVQNFGNAGEERRAAKDGHVLCDLSHFGLIRAEGEDGQAFLQGQFSNDVQQVGPQSSQINSYNTPKGRMLASFRLFMRDGAYYLRMPGEIIEPTLKRLRMFVLRSKVSLEDAGEALVRVGFSGPEAEQRLKAVAGDVPEAVDGVSQSGGLTILRVPGVQPRFEIYGEMDGVKRLWEALASDAQPAGAGTWDWLEIRAGVPNIYGGTQEAFVAQMVNLHVINGVSFTKGCYPGQEVVARMHYLGKLKRRMYLAHTDGGQPPAPGDGIFEAGKEQSAGSVVAAQESPDGGYDLLAVLQIASAGAELHLGSGEGAVISLGELPYPVSEEA